MGIGHQLTRYDPRVTVGYLGDCQRTNDASKLSVYRGFLSPYDNPQSTFISHQSNTAKESHLL